MMTRTSSTMLNCGSECGRPSLIPNLWVKASVFYHISCRIFLVNINNCDWDSQVPLVVKNMPANAGDIRDQGSILGLGRAAGGGHGNPPQYSCLENAHGQRNLVGYTPWSFKESDMTEQLSKA